jgi:hypothetical protein
VVFCCLKKKKIKYFQKYKTKSHLPASICQKPENKWFGIGDASMDKRKNDGLKKLIVICTLILTLIGIVPAGSRTITDNRTTMVVSAQETEDLAAADDTEQQTEEEPEGSTEEETTENVSSDEEVPEEPAYTVTDMSAVLYAQTDSNVRKGPSTDYEVIGGLATNQEVTVTGRADTGWYRIEYNGGEGFVAGSLLKEEKVVIPEHEPTPADNTDNTESAETTDTSDETQTTEPEQPQQTKQRWEYTEDELIQLSISECITAGMSDYEKAVAVNDYLCNLMSYDYTYTHRSTFDALAYGTGVCQGYANAYQKMMNALGIQTDFIGGYGWNGQEWASHGWNRVLIDGQYYYVDSCWNDSLGYNKYLLMDYDTFSQDHAQRSVNPKRIM